MWTHHEELCNGHVSFFHLFVSTKIHYEHFVVTMRSNLISLAQYVEIISNEITNYTENACFSGSQYILHEILN